MERNGDGDGDVCEGQRERDVFEDRGKRTPGTLSVRTGLRRMSGGQVGLRLAKPLFDLSREALDMKPVRA